MVDSYGRYWFQGMDAQAEFRLVQDLAKSLLEKLMLVVMTNAMLAKIK